MLEQEHARQLEFNNTGLQGEIRAEARREARRAVEEKDTQLALLNDDLTDAQQNVVALEKDNVKLQAEVKKLAPRAVLHLKDPRKDNGKVVIQKNNGAPYPYLAVCGQQGYVAQKIRNKLVDYPNGQIVVLTETPTRSFTTTGSASEAALLQILTE